MIPLNAQNSMLHCQYKHVGHTHIHFLPTYLRSHTFILAKRSEMVNCNGKHTFYKWPVLQYSISHNIYAVPTRYTKFFNELVYSARFVSSTCFGPHRSIFRSVLYKLYSQTLVCGNTRTTRHVQLLRSN
jgi:hypothetical protein